MVYAVKQKILYAVSSMSLVATQIFFIFIPNFGEDEPILTI